MTASADELFVLVADSSTRLGLKAMPLREWQAKHPSPPVLKLRMLPGKRCTGCSASGYVDEKSGLCAWCLAPQLALFHRRRSRR